MPTAQPQAAYAAPMDDSTDAAGAGAPDTDESQDDGSYVIEIRVGGDKSISVCVESGADEAGEESGGGEGAGEASEDDAGGDSGMGDYVPCKSIKEALTLALEIFRADGQMPNKADDDFQQGFQGANS